MTHHRALIRVIEKPAELKGQRGLRPCFQAMTPRVVLALHVVKELSATEVISKAPHQNHPPLGMLEGCGWLMLGHSFGLRH